MSTATLFAAGVGILAVGWLWFYIVRPILEDYGIIVNSSEDAAPVVMSRSEKEQPPSPRPSLETANQTDRQTEQPPRIKADDLLTLCRLMRAAGIGREDAQEAFRASGLPFNNNVWAKAQPPAKPVDDEDDTLVTPYAGRRTRASYYPDEPELEFNAPS